MFVAQTVNLPASVKIRLPVLRRESFDRFPLTGWSRFAIQTMVRELLNHMAKQKALSPTPAEKTPFGDFRASSVFSIERDVAPLLASNVEDESGKGNAKESRRAITGQAMMFLKEIDLGNQ